VTWRGLIRRVFWPAKQLDPICTSPRFGPRMYCFFEQAKHALIFGPMVCMYCGLAWEPMPPEQRALIEAGRNETWWRREDD
jgi:hypothetical protein